jgi:CBS domain-containing protein/mannitol/fructose-specific phosphotransferase system IIA component (Ntr-type)
MRLQEILREENILIPLPTEDVGGAVRALVDLLDRNGDLADPAAVKELLEKPRSREGVAVGPHLLLAHQRTDAVGRLVVALGVTEAPLPGGKVGKGGQRVVALVLAPPRESHAYLQLIAALVRELRDEEVVERLLAARSAAEVLAVPELAGMAVQPRLVVRDVMTPHAFQVSVDTSLRELIELMSRHDLKAVPVVGEKGEVLGMVTDRDLLRHLLPSLRGGAEKREGAQPATVREVMTRSVMCISEEQSLLEIAGIMVNKDVERFPVVREGALSGFLTRGDLLRKLFGT